ncbi:MAG: sensory box protein, partial [Akkermansiaceae bacterium]|nr:sensory box protein [Akkermansiaceae bacterium]
GIVRIKTGHDFSNYKRPTLLRRIDRRLQVHELPSMAAYVKLLREQPEEVRSLLRDLLITVTNFFRDRDSFDYLEKQVIPLLFEGKTAGDCVRVWSCGTGTGEEAYTLAMLLMEHQSTLPDPPRIQVFASDINEDALRIARDGSFSTAIAGDLLPHRLRRFFVKRAGNYCVTKDLRDAVLFAPHNVLRDPPFSQLDLISCRNLLIYLNRETQKKVMEIFNFGLNPGAYLFLGSSEGIEASEALFGTVDKKHRVYRNLQASKRSLAALAPASGTWEARPPDSRPLGSATTDALELLHLRLANRDVPPSVLINASHEIVHLSEGMADFTLIPAGAPTRDLIKSVRPSLRLDLRAILMTAERESREVEVEQVKMTEDASESFATLRVRPVDLSGIRYYLVTFDRNSSRAPPLLSGAVYQAVSGELAMGLVLKRLEEELQESRDRLRLTMEHGGIATEELKASNEELQAINEELRSTTEELETSREELQSMNEEMVTINHELKDKIEEISSSNSDLQNLMHSTDIGTIFLDRQLNIKRYTRRVEQLFNIIHTDIGRPLAHLTHKFDYQDLAADAATVLTSLQTVERDIHVASSGASYLARLGPYRTTEDRIEGVVISFVDITELTQTANSLLEREHQLRMAQEAARAGVWSLDLKTGDAWWSEEYVKLHGGRLASVEPTMENWLRNFHPREVDKVSAQIQSAIRNRSQYIYEFKLDLPSGEHWVMEVGRAIYDADGLPIQMAGISMDVTERILLRQEQAALLHRKDLHELSLREAHRRKDEFLAMVAHELRTPLAPVRTGIEILKNSSLGPNEAANVISTLERQVVQMVRLIDDLLDVSRITSGKLVLEHQAVDLDQILDQAVETIQPLLDQQQHEFVQLRPETPSLVWGDAPRLVQVFSNLLNNAAKYTAPHGRISIELKVEMGEAVIVVRDNGEGIDPAMHDLVFDMFGQVSRPERLPQGLGIGLSLVRSIVTMHGGTIELRSQGKGTGSEFTVRLPRLVETPPPASLPDPKATAAPVLPTHEIGKVMVVDDGISAADILSMFLELEGLTAFTAYDGPSALELIEKERPDVVFSDIGMPGMDGHELARRIRALPYGAEIILVALTGWGQESDRLKSKDAGFDHHLTKPVDPKTLRSFLSDCRKLPASEN